MFLFNFRKNSKEPDEATNWSSLIGTHRTIFSNSVSGTLKIGSRIKNVIATLIVLSYGEISLQNHVVLFLLFLFFSHVLNIHFMSLI